MGKLVPTWTYGLECPTLRHRLEKFDHRVAVIVVPENPISNQQ